MIGKHAVSVLGGTVNVKGMDYNRTILPVIGFATSVLLSVVMIANNSTLNTPPTLARSLSYTSTSVSRSNYRNRLNDTYSSTDHVPSSLIVDGSWSLDENDKVPYSKSYAEKAYDLMADQTSRDIQTLEDKGEGTVIVDSDLTLTADVMTQLNKQYAGHEPTGWNPDHPTGDNGNVYSFSQCTWWAYKRRHELGLPAGSHMGDGRMWATTGKILGYWVDHTPHIGDAFSFPAGVLGSSAQYGHVAIVENVFQYDGKTYIKTSESGASFNGHHFSRILSDPERFEYVHY